eukprot:270500-Prorocentrum_minimum.AAC.4
MNATTQQKTQIRRLLSLKKPSALLRAGSRRSQPPETPPETPPASYVTGPLHPGPGGEHPHD